MDAAAIALKRTYSGDSDEDGGGINSVDSSNKMPPKNVPRRKGRRRGGGDGDGDGSKSLRDSATVTGGEMIRSSKKTKKKSSSSSSSSDAMSCMSVDGSNSAKSNMLLYAAGGGGISPIRSGASSAFAPPMPPILKTPLLTTNVVLHRAPRHSDRLPEKQARALREYGSDSKRRPARKAAVQRTKSRSLSPRRTLRSEDTDKAVTGTAAVAAAAAAAVVNEKGEKPEKEKEATTSTSTTSRQGIDHPTKRSVPRRSLSSDGNECGRRSGNKKNKNNANTSSKSNNLQALARSAKKIKKISTESISLMGDVTSDNSDNETDDDYDPLLYVLQEEYQQQQVMPAVADAAAGGGAGTMATHGHAEETTNNDNNNNHDNDDDIIGQQQQQISIIKAIAASNRGMLQSHTTSSSSSGGGGGGSTHTNIAVESLSVLPTKRTTADTTTAVSAAAATSSRRAGGLVGSDSAIILLAQITRGYEEEEEKKDAKKITGTTDTAETNTSLGDSLLHDLDVKKPLPALFPKGAAATGDSHTVGGGGGNVIRRRRSNPSEPSSPSSYPTSSSSPSASVNPKNNVATSSPTTAVSSPCRRPTGRSPRPTNSTSISNHLERRGANSSRRIRPSGAATVQGLTTTTTTPSSPRKKPSRPGGGSNHSKQQHSFLMSDDKRRNREEHRLLQPQQHRQQNPLPLSPRKNGARPPPPPPPPTGLSPVSSLDTATAETGLSVPAVDTNCLETAEPAPVGASVRPRRSQPKISGVNEIALEKKEDKLLVETGNNSGNHQQTSAPIFSIQQENPQSGTLHESPTITEDQNGEPPILMKEEASKQPLSSRMSPIRRPKSSRDIGKMIQQAGSNTVNLRSSAATVQGVIGSTQSDAQKQRNACSDDNDMEMDTNKKKKSDKTTRDSPSKKTSTMNYHNLPAPVGATIADRRVKRMSIGYDTIASDDTSCFSIEEFKAPAAAGNNALDVPPSPTRRAAKRPGEASDRTVKITSDMTVAPSIDTDSSMMAEQTDEPAKPLDARPQVVPEGPRPANLSDEAQEGSMFEIFQKLQKMKEEKEAVAKPGEIDVMGPKNSASIPAEAESLVPSEKSPIKDKTLPDIPTPASPRLANVQLQNRMLSRSPRVSGVTPPGSSKSPSHSRLALRTEQSPRTQSPHTVSVALFDVNPPLSPSSPIDLRPTLRIDKSPRTNMPRAVLDAHPPLAPMSPKNATPTLRITQSPIAAKSDPCIQEPSPTSSIPRLESPEKLPQSHVNRATPLPQTPPSMGRSSSPQRVMSPQGGRRPNSPQRVPRANSPQRVPHSSSPHRVPNSGSTQVVPSNSPDRIQGPASAQRSSRPVQRTMRLPPHNKDMDSNNQQSVRSKQIQKPSMPLESTNQQSLRSLSPANGVDQRNLSRQVSPQRLVNRDVGAPSHSQPSSKSETQSDQQFQKNQLSERRLSIHMSPSKNSPQKSQSSRRLSLQVESQSPQNKPQQNQLSERRLSLQVSPSNNSPRRSQSARRLSVQLESQSPQKPQQKDQPVGGYMCPVSPRRLTFEEGSREQLQQPSESRPREMPQQTRPQGATLSDKLDRGRAARPQTGRSSASVSSAPVQQQRPRRQISPQRPVKPQAMPQSQSTRLLPHGPPLATTTTAATTNSRPSRPASSKRPDHPQPRKQNRSTAKNPTRRKLQQKPQQVSVVSEQSPTANATYTIRLPRPTRGGTNSPNDVCRTSRKDMKENTMENQSAEMRSVSNPATPPPHSDIGSNHGSTSLDEDEKAAMAVEQTPDNNTTPRKRREGVGALLLGRIAKIKTRPEGK